ncbi:MAG: hypothetical protein KF744_13715 [Taibaiella sp.]|nr:hypothetical protein [Taibaiella sp.]
MKHTILLLMLCVVVVSSATAQAFNHRAGMYLRNELSYIFSNNQIDSIEVFDPVSRASVFLTEQRSEIATINGIWPLRSNQAIFNKDELTGFESYVAGFFQRALEKTGYVSGTYRLHLCGIIVDRNGKICKYEYHGLDMHDDNGILRDVYPLDLNLVKEVMSRAPLVHPSASNGQKRVDFAYIPEVILSRTYTMRKDKTTITKISGTPAAQHSHHTRRL